MIPVIDSQRPALGTCLVVGASCRSLAQSLQLAGWRVCAIDLFADRDLQEIAPVRQIERLDDWATIRSSIESLFGSETPDRIFLAGGMENHGQILLDLESVAPLAGPQIPHILEMRQWYELRKLTCECGIHLPESWFFDSKNTRVPSLCSDVAWLSKSTKSSGGLRVKDWLPNQEANPCHGMIQRRIEGEELGVTFVSDSTSCRPMAAMGSWKSSAGHEFLYQGSLGPVLLSQGIQDSLQRFADAIFKRWRFRGWIQADFMVDTHQSLWLLEINPRWSSSMELIEYVANVRLSRLLSQSFNDVFDPWPSRLQSPGLFAGKRILYADRERKISQELSDRLMSQRFEPTIQDREGHRDREGQWVADIPPPGTVLRLGQPMWTAIVAADSIEAVREGLREADCMARERSR